MTMIEKTLNIYTTSSAGKPVGCSAAPIEFDDVLTSQAADIHLEVVSTDDDIEGDRPTSANFIGDISFETYNLDTLDDLLNGKPYSLDVVPETDYLPSHLHETISLLMDWDKSSLIADHFDMRGINHIVTLDTIHMNEDYRENSLTMEVIDLFMRLTGTSRTLFMITPACNLSVASYFAGEDVEQHFKDHGFVSMEEITGKAIKSAGNSDWEVLYKPAFKLSAESSAKAA